MGIASDLAPGNACYGHLVPILLCVFTATKFGVDVGAVDETPTAVVAIPMIEVSVSVKADVPLRHSDLICPWESNFKTQILLVFVACTNLSPPRINPPALVSSMDCADSKSG